MFCYVSLTQYCQGDRYILSHFSKAAYRTWDLKHLCHLILNVSLEHFLALLLSWKTDLVILGVPRAPIFGLRRAVYIKAETQINGILQNYSSYSEYMCN